MIGTKKHQRAVEMPRQYWESLSPFWQWCGLLGLLAVAFILTLYFRWGQLPATPFYPVVLISVALGSERQGMVLTLLSVGAALAASFLLRLPSAYAQEGTDSAVLALVGAVMIMAMHQRRSMVRLTKSVVYESGVVRALGNYALTRLSRDEMQKVIVRYIANSTDAVYAFVAMPDEAETLLCGYGDSNGLGNGPRPVARSIADTFVGDVYTAATTGVLRDTALASRFVPVDNISLRSVVAVPLLLANHPIGVLMVGSLQTNNFTSEDVMLLETLARSIAVPLYASRGARVGKRVVRARS